MNDANLHTKSLDLVPHTLDSIRAVIAALAPEDRAAVSPEWLRLLDEATEVDPWTYGFMLMQRDGEVAVGTCGFKGPPTAEGVVEIAYAVDPAWRGRGYATETAAALTNFAWNSGRVRLVIAHTLPEPNASIRVLTKCGFRHVGDVIDPEDGPVWRWEKDGPVV